MSNVLTRPTIAAATLILFFLVGCRNQATTIRPQPVTQEVTRIVSENVVTNNTVEVTRIVKEIVEVTRVPETEPASLEPAALTICMVNEPASLYLYDTPRPGIPALARKAVFHAIYESLYTTLSYEYQARGLQKMPDLADGDAEIAGLLVSAGDMVVNSGNQVVTLKSGERIRDLAGDEITFEGTPVTVPQMVVRFSLRPMIWSDGTPVTAADSQFSYEIAAAANTAGDRFRVDRTASYQATGPLTLQWTGVPGWLDPTYFTNVWSPLPRHQLEHYTPAELVGAPEVTEMPLSNGPYVVKQWLPGERLELVKNPYYYLADEGLPLAESVTYRFVQNTNRLIALLLSGQCDIGTQDGLDLAQVPLLLEAQATGLLIPFFQQNNVFEHIDFGINPIEAYQETRPDWFEDARVRRAMVMCTDRQAMVDQVLFGQSEVSHAYVSRLHPLYPDDLRQWPYDVSAANQLLDEVGYSDLDDDGIRQDPRTRQPFQVSLGYNSGNQMRQQVAQMFQKDMLDCGILVELVPHMTGEWFAPQGPLFGRRFDLAQFPWIVDLQPACDLYSTTGIPTEENDWLGNNETGWSNSAYDAACASALAALVGSETYLSQHQEALRIFAEQVPVIPLFSHLKIAALQPQVRNFSFDPTQESELWNIYELHR